MTPSLYPLVDLTPKSRRTFLKTSLSLAAASWWSGCATGAVVRHPSLPAYPFQLGVASGDPAPDGFVLWTRLAPRPLEGGGMIDSPVEVSWIVCEDEGMSRLVQRGKTVARPEWAHSVHVEVQGLRPDRWYFYQFTVGNETSPTGRTRTLPLHRSAPGQLRFAMASCQHFESGYFNAYEHMLKEDVDLVLHLGDYIYEGAGRDKQIRKHVGPELYTLQDYRNRHAQYKTDSALQAMHAAAPWFVTWDDHEFDNNCAGDVSEELHVQKQEFLRRRAQAYQAYYEHMPLRRRSLPHGPGLKLYRSAAYGNLAELFVLDTRQYRSDQPCGDGTRTPCGDAYKKEGTLLGERQRDWLLHRLNDSAGRWNILAQQVMMARVDRAAGDAVACSMDQWPGYEFERRQILRFLEDRKISNPVVLAGDIHTNWANNLVLDDPKKVIASEFVGTSITSGGDGTAEPKNLQQLYRENPFVKFHNAQRGYVLCEITPEKWVSHYRVVDSVTRKESSLSTKASMMIENGRPSLVKLA